MMAHWSSPTPKFADVIPLSRGIMTELGQTRSFGDVGSMSSLPESGHGWAIYEYTPSCNGPGGVKSPRVIVTPPSSRSCPWSAPRPHYAVRRNGEPI